jgi:hypothetical protein
MSFTLQNTTQPLIERMLVGLRQQGSYASDAQRIPGPPETLTYIVKGNGIVARVVVHIEAKATVITVLDKPFLVPESMIEQKVREALAMART